MHPDPLRGRLVRKGAVLGNNKPGVRTMLVAVLRRAPGLDQRSPVAILIVSPVVVGDHNSAITIAYWCAGGQCRSQHPRGSFCVAVVRRAIIRAA